LTTQYFEEALLDSQLTVEMRVRPFWQVALWRVLADFGAIMRYLRVQARETVTSTAIGRSIKVGLWIQLRPTGEITCKTVRIFGVIIYLTQMEAKWKIRVP
jgi:hypothetical protein